MFELFEKTTVDCSKIITEAYSTSFSLGIRTLHKRLHAPIYGIYGFVRYADEIVDTMHDYDKRLLLQQYKNETYRAISQGISLNPILHAYQKAVNEYRIPMELTESFFKSMEMDLDKTAYGQDAYHEYIYGSAEVVGLMCLKVFCNGEEEMYERLMPSAKALGAAFQKVNFLRDMKSDHEERGRVYFPGIDFANFKEESKRQIEQEIAADFAAAYDGLMQLPVSARGGVLLAYKYYLRLFEKIRKIPVEEMKEARIRIPDLTKLYIWASTTLQMQLGTQRQQHPHLR